MYAASKPRRSTSTTTGTGSFKAPSRNANIQCYDRNSNTTGRSPRSFVRRDVPPSSVDETMNIDICDETWPLDQVINKIELNDGLTTTVGDIDTTTWQTGPRIISENFNSGRDMKRIPGNGMIISSFNHGSKTWKDKQIKHHRYKVKKDDQQKIDYPAYDTNNNFLGMESYIGDDHLDDNFNDDFDDDDDSPTLRDVGIQCNLRRYNDDRKESSLLSSSLPLTKKPPIRVIKSTNNGMVSTFSDVPKLSSPAPTNGGGVDAIYSQIDKTYKKNNNPGNGGNINIVYKQPLNEKIDNNHSGSGLDIKTKGIGLNVSNDFGPKISLPNPYSELSLRSGGHRKDKEILEETISIADSITDDELAPNRTIRAPSPIKIPDNYSLTSKSSSLYQRKDSPAGRDYHHNHHHHGSKKSNRNKNKINNTTPKTIEYENDENVLLENNSLRLKSSRRSPKPMMTTYNLPERTTERLHKSNADLREQFLRDETRGGLATAYKNRQQKNGQYPGSKQHHRTLSLNRMNGATIEDHHHPNRHLSSSHISTGSRLGSDTGSTGGGYPRSSRTLMQHHDRDPIVMYIPPARGAINDNSSSTTKLTSILRNNSTKTVKPVKSQSRINLKDHDQQQRSDDQRKKRADINRRYSMPKDTKFNWLNKFKLKK